MADTTETGSRVHPTSSPVSRDRLSVAIDGDKRKLLIVPVVLFAVSRVVTQPFVYPDEAGALMNARFLSGGGPRSPEWYLPGYGALLAPVLAFTTNLAVISFSIHVLNALLGGLTALGLFLIGRMFFPDTSPRRVASAAIATSFYPAYLYFASLALADNLMVTGSVWSVILVDRVRRHPTAIESYGLVLLLGAFMSVHSRSPTIVLSGILVLAIWPETRKLAAVGFAAAIVAYFVGRMAIDMSQPSIFVGSRHGMSALISANASLRSIAILPFTALGQIINLVASTAGLIVIGFVAVVRFSRGVDPRSRALGIQVLAMLGSATLLSSLYWNETVGDGTIYARYIEVVMALPLFFGILLLLDKPLPRWFIVLVPVGVLAAAWLLVAVRGSETFTGPLSAIGYAGVAALVMIMGRIDPVAIAVLGAVATTLVATVSRFSRRGGRTILVSAFSINSLFLFATASIFIENSAQSNELSDEIRNAIAVGAEPCIALDQTGLPTADLEPDDPDVLRWRTFDDNWSQTNYRVQNLDLEFVTWQSGQNEEVPCEDLVISTNGHPGDELPGWETVAWEFDQPQWLWVSPAVLEHFGSDEIVSPPPGAALPAVAADLDLEMQQSPDLLDGVEVIISVTNTSSGFTYVPPANLGTDEGSVRLEVGWRSPDDPSVELHSPVLVDLEEPLRPGATQTVTAILPTDLGEEIGRTKEWVIVAELSQQSVVVPGSGAASARLVVMLPGQ